MTDTTDALVERLRDLLGKATPGPWKVTPSVPEVGYECFWLTACPAPNQEREVATVNGPQNERNMANAELICAAVNAAPALLDTIAALSGRLAMERGINNYQAARIAALEGTLREIATIATADPEMVPILANRALGASR